MEEMSLETDDWLGPALPKRYGTWPGGLQCALTIDPSRQLRPEMLPLEVWTLKGEHRVFAEYRTDGEPGRS
jgi:hypothetical protein